PGAGLLGSLVRAKRRHQIEEDAVLQLKRVEERAAERLSVERVGDRRAADELPAGAANHRAPAAPPPLELRVVENPGAAANDGRTTAVADVPRKAGRGREVLVLLLRRAQVAAVDRREIRRLRQVIVQDVGFMLPSEPVVQR